MNLNTEEADHCNRGEQEEEEQGEIIKQNFHVLAVDDSHIDRKLLERLLTVSSYQVTCVDSGDKALEYLGLIDNIQVENEYDTTSLLTSSATSSSQQYPVSKVVNLIMTDYSMPGISGYDLLKRVKDSNWKDIPVVVMSSENVQSRINMCLEGGAEEFLLKPVKLSDLTKLHSHLLIPNNFCNGIATNGDHNSINKNKNCPSNCNKIKPPIMTISSGSPEPKNCCPLIS